MKYLLSTTLTMNFIYICVGHGSHHSSWQNKNATWMTLLLWFPFWFYFFFSSFFLDRIILLYEIRLEIFVADETLSKYKLLVLDSNETLDYWLEDTESISVRSYKERYFNRLGGYWFTRIDLFSENLTQNQSIIFYFSEWNLPMSTTAYNFIESMLTLSHIIIRANHKNKLTQQWDVNIVLNKMKKTNSVYSLSTTQIWLFWNFRHLSKISHQIHPITFSVKFIQFH